MRTEAHITVGVRDGGTLPRSAQDRHHASVRLFAFFSHDSPAAGLPDFSGMQFNGSQPAMSPAGGIDTHRETQIKNFGVLLFGMSDNDCLS